MIYLNIWKVIDTCQQSITYFRSEKKALEFIRKQRTIVGGPVRMTMEEDVYKFLRQDILRTERARVRRDNNKRIKGLGKVAVSR